jgi:hypothetical protein
MIPRPFDFDITPRSAQHATMIREAFRAATPSFERYEDRLSKKDKQWVMQSRLDADDK